MNVLSRVHHLFATSHSRNCEMCLSYDHVTCYDRVSFPQNDLDVVGGCELTSQSNYDPALWTLNHSVELWIIIARMGNPSIPNISAVPDRRLNQQPGRQLVRATRYNRATEICRNDVHEQVTRVKWPMKHPVASFKRMLTLKATSDGNARLAKCRMSRT